MNPTSPPGESICKMTEPTAESAMTAQKSALICSMLVPPLTSVSMFARRARTPKIGSTATPPPSRFSGACDRSARTSASGSRSPLR